MSIEEQIEVISTGSPIYTNIELLLDLIQEADLPDNQMVPSFGNRGIS